MQNRTEKIRRELVRLRSQITLGELRCPHLALKVRKGQSVSDAIIDALEVHDA